MKNVNIKFVTQLITSFLLALLIWYFINGSTTNIVTRTVMNIPVTVTGNNELSDKGLVLEDDVNYFVNLELRGTENNLDQVNTDDLTAEINLSEIDNSGSVTVPIVIRGLNNAVILDQTVPSEVQLQVEKITDQAINPLILTQGKPEEGYSVISSTTGETVSVSGEEDQIRKIDRISGIANVDGLSTNSYQLVQLNAYDSEGNILRGITLTPNVVEAEIIIGVIKQVSVTPPEVMSSPQIGYQITDVSVKPKTIKIAGDPDTIEEINSINVTPVSFNEALLNHSFIVESNMILPENTSVIGSNALASVEVFIEKINEKSISITDIEVVGLEDSLEIDRISPGSISMKISGTSAALNKYDNSNVKALVDVSGLGVGEYTLPINLNLSDVNIIELNPIDVTVRIDEKT